MTATPPRFSIITVTLNNRAGLTRTRNSIKSQSFQGFEWIIIDGGSTDGTQEDLQNETLWISELDRGIYDAMNKGIAKAGGEYLLFLNAGDTLAGPATLEVIEAAISAQKIPPDFIYGNSIESGFYKTAKPPHTKNRGMFTHHQAMLYRHEVLGGLRYDIRYKIAADYDFTCRFVRSIKGILYCPFAICIFEAGGISQQKAKLGREEQFTIRKKLDINTVENKVIYVAQSLIWKARKMAPKVYWKIKSSGNKRSDSGRI